MLGSWVFYAVVALTTLTGGLLATKKGRGWLKRQRRKVGRKAKRDTVGAIRHRRKVRAQTPRGKLRAKRRAQPKRITAGHVREPGDPTRTRRAARWVGTKAKDGTRKAARTAADRYRVRRENRKGPKPAPKPVLALGPGPVKRKRSTSDTRHEQNLRYLRSRGYCTAKCQDGTNCLNKASIGSNRCHVHGGRSAA